MAPKMKAKRSASGDSVPTGDMPQAVRDLDHKLHDLVAAYDDGKKEILAKMGDSKNLNNKMDNTHKAVADSLEELTKLRDLMKENQETIDKLKSDSALANEKMKELVSKVTLMEEQLNMKKNDGSSSICTGDLASKLTTVQQNTGEILSKVKVIEAQQGDTV